MSFFVSFHELNRKMSTLTFGISKKESSYSRGLCSSSLLEEAAAYFRNDVVGGGGGGGGGGVR